MSRPLAYHITWGTYGTRLHGDRRGTVDRRDNAYGTPVLGADPERHAKETENLKFPPVELTIEERLFIEAVIPSICERGHWIYRVCAAGPDHVHVLLTSTFDPETIRKLLKRWLGQELSARWALPGGATWWAEDGSIKWVTDELYFENAFDYVRRQRTTRGSPTP